MTTDNTAYYGQADPATDQGEWNRLRFAIQQQILELNTSLPVKVISVQASGVTPVGFVSVQILVDQITGDGKTVEHGVIPNVPYFRLQGGSNAVIIDPQVGDIGMACFASRDISAVKNARQVAPPGSRRAYDFSDAMYIGGFLNSAPAQYIHFTESGIVVYSPSSLTFEAPNMNFKGNAAFSDGTLTHNGKNVGSTHVHSGPASAPTGPVSNTGQPL